MDMSLKTDMVEIFIIARKDRKNRIRAFTYMQERKMADTSQKSSLVKAVAKTEAILRKQVSAALTGKKIACPSIACSKA